MAISHDVESLICELGASLAPPQRIAFEAAAHVALGVINCSGCGAAYRVLAPLQRQFFDPPPDDRLAHTGARHHRPSKLIDAPALGEDSARCGERHRNAFRTV